MRWRRRPRGPANRDRSCGSCSKSCVRPTRRKALPRSRPQPRSSAALDAHLSELKAEQASADQRTQSRLADLQGVLETLAARLANIESELAADDIDEELRPPARSASPAPALKRRRRLRSRTATRGPDQGDAPKIRRLKPPTTARTTSSSPARARRRARAKPATSPRSSGPRPILRSASTSPRRGAPRRRMAENNAAINSGGVPTLDASERLQFATRGVQSARAFYVAHRRTVSCSASRSRSPRRSPCDWPACARPFCNASNSVDKPSIPPKSTRPRGSRRRSPGAVKPSRETIDVAPTASIAQPPAKPGAPDLAPESGPTAGELMATIPAGIPSSLRDATAAGQPNAQYELAMRLFEGRGLPKDQPAAARWFERAASAGTCSRAVSAWLDVRKGNWRDPRPGGREALVSQGG